jgi:hypothetical protein
MKNNKTIITLSQTFSGIQIFYALSFKMKHYLITRTHRRSLHTLSVVAVMVYPNADLQKIQILLENKHKSGIYR